jgi:hypothetical protein
MQSVVGISIPLSPVFRLRISPATGCNPYGIRYRRAFAIADPFDGLGLSTSKSYLQEQVPKWLSPREKHRPPVGACAAAMMR